MYKKNDASPKRIFAGVVNASTGEPVTGGVAIKHYDEDGTQTTGDNSANYELNGTWSYVPSQAETNETTFAIKFYHADAVGDGPLVQVITTQLDPDDAVRMGMSALPNAAADVAGGLPISDAGGLDLDALNTAAVRLTAARAGALTDWIDGGRLDLLLDAIPTTAMRGTDSAALASVCTEGRLAELAAANIPADLDTLLGRLTAARAGVLTDWINGGRLDLLLDAIKVITDALTAAAAAKLALSAGTIVTGAAAAGTLSTTQMTTNLTEVTNDHYNGRIIIWTSGVLQSQATDITDYDGATKMLTYTATTEAPAATDTFVIL